MRCLKMHLRSLCLIFLAAVPAYCQRGTFGIFGGASCDQFATFACKTNAISGVDGEITVHKPSKKNGGPSIVAGGEIRLPSDTSFQAREYAVYGGAIFHAHRFDIGFHGQIRKADLPQEIVGSQVLNRGALELLEAPAILRYNFGTGNHFFLQAEGAPEFTPHFKNANNGLPHPSLDHGYFVRGTAGYTFGKWYARASYETRYFKFSPTIGNPEGLYNWKSNLMIGGVGVRF